MLTFDLLLVLCTEKKENRDDGANGFDGVLHHFFVRVHGLRAT